MLASVSCRTSYGGNILYSLQLARHIRAGTEYRPSTILRRLAIHRALIAQAMLEPETATALPSFPSTLSSAGDRTAAQHARCPGWPPARRIGIGMDAIRFGRRTR